MPTAGPKLGAAVRGILESRGIGFHQQTIEQIEPRARELVLANGEQVPFGLLLGIPPHRAPAVLAQSSLTSETGFVPVDRATLATTSDGVYAIGDATTIPLTGGKFLPKAGVFANKQAQQVAARIAAELSDTTPTGGFTGTGACFLEMGDGIVRLRKRRLLRRTRPDHAAPPPRPPLAPRQDRTRALLALAVAAMSAGAVRPKEFHFPLSLEWVAGRSITAQGKRKPISETTTPPVLHGTDSSTWSPEELSVAAAASFLAVRFVGLATRTGLTHTSLAIDGDGVVGLCADGRFGLTRLLLRLDVEVDQADELRVRGLAQKAEESRLVSVSLDLPAETEIEVRPATPAASSGLS